MSAVDWPNMIAGLGLLAALGGIVVAGWTSVYVSRQNHLAIRLRGALESLASAALETRRTEAEVHERHVYRDGDSIVSEVIFLYAKTATHVTLEAGMNLRYADFQELRSYERRFRELVGVPALHNRYYQIESSEEVVEEEVAQLVSDWWLLTQRAVEDAFEDAMAKYAKVAHKSS